MKNSTVMRSTRLAGHVLRYHSWDLSRPQSVAAHTWQVMRLYIQIFGRPRAEVLEYIVFHDVAELQVSDLQYPIKANNPVLKTEMDRLESLAAADMGIAHHLNALTPAEKVRFKFCDLLDCVELGREEVLRGNQMAQPIADQWRNLNVWLRQMSSADQCAAARYCAERGIDLPLNELDDFARSVYTDFRNDTAANAEGFRL